MTHTIIQVSEYEQCFTYLLSINNDARFAVFTAVKVQFDVFWVVTSSVLLGY